MFENRVTPNRQLTVCYHSIVCLSTKHFLQSCIRPMSYTWDFAFIRFISVRSRGPKLRKGRDGASRSPWTTRTKRYTVKFVTNYQIRVLRSFVSCESRGLEGQKRDLLYGEPLNGFILCGLHNIGDEIHAVSFSLS